MGDLIVVDFRPREHLRSDRYRVTSATRGEVRARAAVERVYGARQNIALPSKDVLANYRRAIEERAIDPIFTCDDNGGAA